MASLRYRPEVDGLRALAVLPVILFHFGVSVDGHRPFDGGYVGVDVFFVISGYLIAGVLLKDLADGQFSFARFYERRARRILPALLTVVAATIPAAFYFMTPDQLTNFSQSVASVTVFASNFLFWKESGYFDTTTELKPLLHTWSLAIEEQFYVLFPILLLAIWRFARSAIVWIFLGLAAASLGAALMLRPQMPDAVFYFLPMRGWELLLGASIAGWEHLRGAIPRTTVSAIAPAIGIAMIVGAVVGFGPHTVHPGLATLLPVGGTMLILLFGGQGDPVSRLLSTSVFVGVGLISYSLYLWHQPLIAFYRLYAIEEPGFTVWAALLAVCFALSALTWRFIEQPCRHRDRVAIRPLAYGAVGASVLFAAVGLSGHITGGYPDRFSGVALDAARTVWAGAGVTQSGRECHARPIEDACRFGPDDASAEWYMVGDSHGPPILAGLLERTDLNRIAVTDFTQSACPFAEGVTVSGEGGRCYRRNLSIAAHLAASQPATVLYVARLPLHLTGVGFDNGEGGIEHLNSLLVPYDGEVELKHDAAVTERAVRSAITMLLDAGHRVILIYPVPEMGWHVPQMVFKRIRFGAGDAEFLTVSQAVMDARFAASRALLDGIGQHDRLLRIRPAFIFCDTLVSARCLAQDGQSVYYSDANHLSLAGARKVVEAIETDIEAKGWSSFR